MKIIIIFNDSSSESKHKNEEDEKKELWTYVNGSIWFQYNNNLFINVTFGCVLIDKTRKTTTIAAAAMHSHKQTNKQKALVNWFSDMYLLW